MYFVIVTMLDFGRFLQLLTAPFCPQLQRFGTGSDQLIYIRFRIFVCSCWSIWSNRNKVVHEGFGYDPQDSNTFVVQYIHRFKEAQHQFGQPRPPEETAVDWFPPPANTIKFNFDGSINQHSGSAGLGVVGRNSSASVVAWRRHIIPSVYNPEFAEAFAARQAVLLATELGYQHVQFEGDCLNIIQALQSVNVDFSAVGS